MKLYRRLHHWYTVHVWARYIYWRIQRPLTKRERRELHGGGW